MNTQNLFLAILKILDRIRNFNKFHGNVHKMKTNQPMEPNLVPKWPQSPPLLIYMDKKAKLSKPVGFRQPFS